MAPPGSRASAPASASASASALDLDLELELVATGVLLESWTEGSGSRRSVQAQNLPASVTELGEDEGLVFRQDRGGKTTGGKTYIRTMEKEERKAHPL